MLKKIAITFLLFISIFSFSQKNRNTVGFIENKGQIIDQNQKENKSVLYLLNTNGLNVQLRKNGFSYDVFEIKTKPTTKTKKQKEEFNLNKFENQAEIKEKIKFHRVDIDFLNSNSNVKLISEEKSVDYDNYYNVVHAPNGITNVHKYQKVTYQNIYNKIDVVFFIPEDSTKVVEYNFVVKPGGKISDIQMQFKGAKTELANNKIKMATRFGAMEETLPMSWIEEENNKKQVSIHYKKIKNNVYGLESSEDVTGKRVIIDPVPIRLWGTYYGDNTNNFYTLGDASITTDSNGNAFMSGSTSAPNTFYATSGAHQTSIPQDIYLDTNGIIVKFNPNGNRLWGTYYGGTNYNHISDIKIDYENNVVITGITQATTNISSIGAFKPNLTGDSDAFLAKFNESGIRIWGTYFGGENNDTAFALDIDNSNNIYIVGFTLSLSGISYNCNFQPQLYDGPQYDLDAFVAKFNKNGNITWGTYAGGEKQDQFTTIVVKDNYLVVGGNTLSFNNISTVGVFQENHDINTHTDGMIFKFSNDGNRLWSTYYGGEQVDYIYAIEADDENNIYIGGETASNNNITTPGSFESSNPNLYKGYIAKLNNNGSRIWGSYLEAILVYSIIFKNNSIYIGGTDDNYTITSNLTNSCSYRIGGNHEGFIGKFSKQCDLIWGSFVGGNSTFERTVIAIDPNNNIIVSGLTTEANNGVTDSNSFQPSILGNFRNYFLMKFNEGELCSINFTPTSNSPYCINSTISFNNIPSGYNYTWIGPNGFTSNLQYPTINNVNSLNSGLYTLNISDNLVCGCQKDYTFNIIVGDNTKPIPTTNPLPTINGDCNTIISLPTATDNCAGLINGITTDQLTNLLPGTHTIHWTYNDGNGNIETQNQTVTINAVSLPITSSPQIFCIEQTTTINDITITGQNIKWYDAPTNGNLLPNTTALVNGTTYYASQTINGCESNRVPVLVQIQNTPTPSGNTNQSFCSTANATVADIITNGINTIWYNSATSTTPLANTTLLANNTTYYATQTINGCVSANRLAVTISLINTLNATNYSTVICDNLNDNTEISNLNTYNSNLISSTGNIFSYYNSYNDALSQNSAGQITNSTNYNLVLGTNTFYVRIASPNTCFQIVTLTIDLVSKPIIPINNIEPLCEGRNITLNGGNNYDSYTWATGETSQQITITQPGNYSVIVTENHGTTTCTSTKNFVVVNSNIATIQEIISSDWTDNNNTITVILHNNSQGDYEYSLNGIDFQDSNVFNNLEAGEYTVFVRDKNGCGMVSGELYLLMYPKFFTPNGDGYNDYWKIKFSENEPNLAVKIFDRYGKLLKHLGMNSMGWDGKYLGKDVPSSDYWFVVTRENGKELKGHFSLKR